MITKHMTKILTVLLVACMALALLTACGSSNSTSPANKTEANPNTLNNNDTPSTESNGPDESLLDAFTYEKSGDQYIITGVKDTNVTELVIPDFVTEIKQYAFKGCENLISLTTPFFGLSADYNVGEIAEYAVIFKSIYGYHENDDGGAGTNHRPPDLVEGIGYSQLYSAPKTLEKLIITGDVQSYPYIGESSSLKYIEFQGKLSDIPDRAFARCYALEKIVLPEGVRSIGERAWGDICIALKEIVLPGSVTTLGDSAFSSCHALESIHYNGTIQQWNAISKGNYWNNGTGNYTIHCTDGDISK